MSDAPTVILGAGTAFEPGDLVTMMRRKNWRQVWRSRLKMLRRSVPREEAVTYRVIT